MSMIINSVLGLATLLLLILSCGLAAWVAFTVRYALRKHSWNTTAGIVTASKVVPNRRCNGLPGHHHRVAYEFARQVSSLEAHEASKRE